MQQPEPCFDRHAGAIRGRIVEGPQKFEMPPGELRRRPGVDDSNRLGPRNSTYTALQDLLRNIG